MNYKMMGRITAFILLLEAAFMLPSILISLYCGDRTAAFSFILSTLITAGAALILLWATRGADMKFRARDGMVCVAVDWIVLSIFGALPFRISGEIPRYIDALFEIVSGFTTTGASIVINVETMSKGILYWRSFSHWVGGMGVLVFLLAIVPLSGRNNGFTLHLLRAESPGPNVGKIVPRMRQTAMILYVLYILLTVTNVLFLLLGGMPVFDAVCTAYGTAGTGGFGVKADSIAGYSPVLQTICTVFMLLFGVNFTIYHLLIRREYREIRKDEELWAYLGIAALATAVISWNVTPSFPSVREAVHHAAFTVSSIMTTTGFCTVDYDKWPTLSKAIILTLMFVGASAGSTGGGFKVSRLLLTLKALRRNIHLILHPNRVQKVRINGQPVPEKVMDNVDSYLSAYVLIVILSFLLISTDRNFTVESNFSAVMCCFNNIGPGLQQVGPSGNFSGYSDLSKLVLIMDMLLGRLEIFPILVLFSRTTWTRK